jgi:hypothetical protein
MNSDKDGKVADADGIGCCILMLTMITVQSQTRRAAPTALVSVENFGLEHYR